ncbi:hypothetical protein, partial [Kitasatospora sp. NPDC056531]|uniref:hypothetical protein n=1 Tax=Kitasatospora sp. NPDC056531 TaxID=3345856 RepID=UPI0036B4434D
MSILSAVRMARHLTTPFGRGADSLALTLIPKSDIGAAQIAAYDFADHEATYGQPADPTYVLSVLVDCDRDTTVTVSLAGPDKNAGSVSHVVPAGTLAGKSYLVSLPAWATSATRLTDLVMTPAPVPHPASAPAKAPPVVGAADRWAITALLGTTAKLLWAIGAERDQLRRHLERTVAQRHLETATGASLDLIGSDLGVPRFPPLPYGFDPATVALYHLDDAAGATLQVEDLTARYPGRNDHHGTIAGPVQPGAVGRFGR